MVDPLSAAGQVRDDLVVALDLLGSLMEQIHQISQKVAEASEVVFH